MKRFLAMALVIFSALAVTVSDADAKRLGGGGSFGRQAPSYSRQAPATPYRAPSNAGQAQPAPATPQSAPRPSPWRGILGGALLGLGLGALFSHLGIGGGFASLLGTLLTVALIAMAIMFLLRLFRGRGNQNQPAYASYTGGGGYAGSAPEIGSRIEPQAQPSAFQAEPAGVSSFSVPPDFDVPAFLRNAKTYFIRLQAAWDRADVNDIREFTTPEMFGELRLQLQERGPSPNQTDVVSLDAELLGIETGANDYLASVRFSGLIKEEENAAAQPFTEIWNLSKPLSGQGGWVLAGIQQAS
jgi:predicted lipid-binding transport protein (Tim44 family)